ncbi:MAG: hypothetical protein AB2693_11810 [Candidatus Thiodiazotropha sp.]
MASTLTSPVGPGFSPVAQQGQVCMPPTYNYVPQYTNLTSVPVNQMTPMNQNAFQNQQNPDLMMQIIQRLDNMDRKLGQLDSIQSSVNMITTRMNSFDQKVNSLEAKMLDIEKSREFDSKSLDEIRKRQIEMDKNLAQIQKIQTERSNADNQVQSNLIEMKCLELKNNLLFFSVNEEAEEMDRQTEQCDRKVHKIMEDHISINDARATIQIKKASRIGKFDVAKMRPILVEFQNFEDRERVRKSSPELKDTVYGISQQFPREVVLKRRKLLPIMKAARRDKKKAYLSFDKLFIDGELYKGPEA